MAKALKAVGTAIVIVGAIAATGGAALALGAGATLGGALSLASSAVLSVGGFSVSAGALLTVGNLVASVGGALSQPRVSTAGSALGWVGDPNGPLHFAAGRIAVGGDLRHKKAYGPNDRMYFSAVTVVSDAGPIDAFESFTANDIAVTFDAGGKANSSYYANVMWRRTQLGKQPEVSYLASPSGLEGGATLPNWGASHKLSGKAAFILTLAENSKQSAYKGQQPKPRHVIRGLKVYDWRLDSTRPGGSGTHRLDNPATWTYSANPILWAVKWILGLWEGPDYGGAPQLDTQVGGMGVKIENVDLDAFTEAANIADTHGWTCAAWPSTDDDKAQVLDAFLQAGGAYYIQRGGKESCLHRAAPRVSVATVTAADTAGPLELDTGASFTQRKNCGVPTYLSEADGWKMTALGLVSSDQWIEEDGGRERSAPVTYSYVSGAKQAAELMCLAIAHTREGIRGRLPLKPYMQGIQPGSAFTITEPEFVLNGLKCLCLETNYDAQTGVHTVTFVSESDGKYDFAFGQAPNPPAPPALEAVDPTYVSPPFDIDWTITPTPGTGSGQLPSFDLSGVVSNDTATSLLVEFYEVPSGANPNDTPPVDTGWQSAGVWPPTATSIPITVQPDRYYWVGVKYIRNSNYSDRQVWGPYLAGKLVAEVPADDPIWEELFNTSKDVLKGAIEDAQALLEEEGRRSLEVADVLDRLGLGLLLDPVERTALIKSETLVEGVGPTGLPETLVQMQTRLVAADAANAASSAQALIDAKVYTDGLRNDSAINYATYTAMGSAISASAASVQSWTTSQIAGAVANLVSSAQLANSLATAQGQWEAYATAAAANAIVGLVAASQLESALATAKGQWESYANAAASGAVVGLDTIAAREAALAATDLSLRSFVTDYVTSATAGLAAIGDLNGVQAAAALALSVAQDAQAKLNEARVRLIANADGSAPALLELYSGASGGSNALLAATQIGFLVGSERRPLLVLSEGLAALNGDLVVTGSIRSNSITKGASVFDATETNVGVNSWDYLTEVSMTTAGGEVRIDFGAQVSAVNTAGPNAVIELRFLRNGTVLRTVEVMQLIGASTVYVQGNNTDPFQSYVQINTVVSSYIHPFMIDPLPGFGARTYRVEMRSAVGATVGSKTAALLEVKR